MKFYFMLLLPLLGSCQVPAKAQDQTPLIPRTEFFTGEERFDFRMNGDASAVYYRNRTDQQSLFRINFDEPGKVDTINLSGSLLSWKPLKTGVALIIQGEKGIELHPGDKGKKVLLPEKTSSANILVRSKTNPPRLALMVNSEDETQSGIYHYSFDSGELKFALEHPGTNQVFFDKDLNLVAGNFTNESGGSELKYREKGQWHTLASHEWGLDRFLGGFSRVLSVSSDGNTIYYTSNKETDKSELYSYDLATGTRRKLASHDQVDLLPFGFSTNSKGHVTSVVGLFAKTIRETVDPSVVDDFIFLDQHLEGDISFGGSSDDGNFWLVREFTGGPNRLHLYNRKVSSLSFITSNYPALEKRELASRHAFSVATEDELELPFHLYLPPGSDVDGDHLPDEPLPTILYVHGGPWVGVAHWNQYFQWRNFQLLANRGYAVINCEFRSSTGLGKDFTNRGDKQWGEAMTKDKATIAQWAIKNKVANPEKIGIWGWSYGGYASLAGLAFYPDLYACGISMYGISDLDSFTRLPFTDNDLWRNRVGDPKSEKDRNMLQAHSPIYHVKDIKAPLMLTTGSLDQRVPQEQMDRMAEAMEKANKEVIYFYYPEEGHDYRQPESWISFWAIGEKFLADHLGGRYEMNRTDITLGNYHIVEGEDYIKSIH